MFGERDRTPARLCPARRRAAQSFRTSPIVPELPAPDLIIIIVASRASIRVTRCHGPGHPGRAPAGRRPRY
eukprot:763695-Hanusia_phi.AAC.7